MEVTPEGKDPVSVSEGAGTPVVVTVKLPLEPTEKLALLADVIVGGASTVRVKLWLAGGFCPLLAPMVIT